MFVASINMVLVIIDIIVSLKSNYRKIIHDKSWKKFYRIQKKMIDLDIELIDEKRGFRKLSERQKLVEEERLKLLNLVEIDKEIQRLIKLPKYAFKPSKTMSTKEFEKLPKLIKDIVIMEKQAEDRYAYP